MENEDEQRIRHIRLSVKECSGEKGYAFGKKEKREVPKRNYKKNVRDILQSAFSVDGRRMNIFEIKLAGKPSPSDIDDIFDYFCVKPAVYLSINEILVKTSSEDFRKVAAKLMRRVKKSVRAFVEDVKLLDPQDKMKDTLSDLVFQEDYPDRMTLIIFLVPGFSQGEIQDLQSQISSLISEPGSLEAIDLSNGILLSSVTAEDARMLITKPYVFQISRDVGLQPPGEVIRFKSPPDIIPPKEDDPVVCVIDTGADPRTLGSALVECSHEDCFPDGADTHGHGTQVSSVVIWGQDMFSEKNQVVGKCRVISYKFDRFGSVSSLYRAVYNAITKFSSHVRIFNLSSNTSIPTPEAERLTTYLDWKIQRENVILVNSVGNIPDWGIEKALLKLRYPEYLGGFPIFPPSDGNNVVGVGSHALKPSKNLAKQFEVSPYSPLGKSSSMNSYSQKPDVIVGDGNYEIENGKVTRPPELGVPVIGLNEEFTRNFGTSLAAPLAASLLAQLSSLYPDISNSETLRALLAASSDILNTHFGSLFQLKDQEDLFSSKNHLLYYSEAILPARILYDTRIKKFTYTYDRVDFFVPEEARSIRIVSVHSDDLPVSKLGLLGSILKIDVYDPENDEKRRSRDAISWCLNRHTPVNFAVFSAIPGMWNLELTVESEDLSRTLTNELKVRYGLAIRVDLQEGFGVPLSAIRGNVVRRMGTLG